MPNKKALLCPLTVAAAMLLAVPPPSTLAQTAPVDEMALSKPLERFTMDDVFYMRGPAAIDGMLQAVRSWSQDGKDLLRVAEARKASAEQAIEIKKLEIQGLKVRRKHAKEAKDEKTVQQIELSIKSEEQAQEILKRMVKLSERDIQVARSWNDWTTAMVRSLDTAKAVGAHRSRSIATPIGQGPAGLHVDPQAYEVYSKQNQAAGELADRCSKVGSDLKKQVQERKALLDDLVKGGYGSKK